MSGKNWSTSESFNGSSTVLSRAGDSRSDNSFISNVNSSKSSYNSLVGSSDIFGNLNNVNGLLNQVFSDIANNSRADYNNQLSRQLMREQNEYNTNSAREAMRFSEKMADKQMAFQKMMSDTSFQRQVEDMKKAGLNPKNALGLIGASTPSGSSASGVAARSGSAVVDTTDRLGQVLTTLINQAPMLYLINAITGGFNSAKKVASDIKYDSINHSYVGKKDDIIDIIGKGLNKFFGIKDKVATGDFNGGTR